MCDIPKVCHDASRMTLDITWLALRGEGVGGLYEIPLTRIFAIIREDWTMEAEVTNDWKDMPFFPLGHAT